MRARPLLGFCRTVSIEGLMDRSRTLPQQPFCESQPSSLLQGLVYPQDLSLHLCTTIWLKSLPILSTSTISLFSPVHLL